MKIDFEGRTWQLEILDIGMAEAEKIVAYTGLKNLSEWESACLDVNEPDWFKSMRGLYWLMIQQNGAAESVTIDSADFKVLRFFQAYAQAIAAEGAKAKAAAGELEADPTKPASAPGVTEPTA